MTKPLGTALCLMFAVAAAAVQAGQTSRQAGAQQSSAARGASLPEAPASADAVLSKYCITCHNEKRRTAGLAIDALDLRQVGAAAETWEKIARKFRTHEMPPPGAPGQFPLPTTRAPPQRSRTSPVPETRAG